MNPAERLRAVTRRGLTDRALALEAADALAGFAAQPAHLVVACRRLLSHHPANAVLWWLSARILAAPDPAAAAQDAVRLLESDRTSSRLAASLPLLDDGEVVAVVGWPPAVDEAMAERQDVAAVSLRVGEADPLPALRHRRTTRTIRMVAPGDPTLGRVRVLLVAAEAVGPDAAVVPAGTAAARAVLDPVPETWLVGGAGRVLPGRLFTAAAAAAAGAHATGWGDDGPGAAHEVVALRDVERLAGPRGVEAPGDGAARTDCPVVPELLRPL